MSDDLTDATARAFRATSIAKSLDRHMKNPDHPRTNKKLLDAVREADTGAPPASVKGDDWRILELKLQTISTLHHIRGFSFGQIDTILHFKKGASKQLAIAYPEVIQLTLREDSDRVLDNFYRNKISVLENLMVAAPNTVKLLKETQEKEELSLDARLKAGDRIFDWTKMILTTKTPKKTKDVLSGDLRKAADEADDTLDMLSGVLGGAVDGSQEN